MKDLSDAEMSLWNSPDRMRKAVDVISCLQDGNIEGALGMLDKVDGRWDLKGFDFSLHEGEMPFMHLWPGGLVGSKRIVEYNDLVLEGIDFTHAAFAQTNWSDCEFRDCFFKQTVLRGSRFEGCAFNHVRFEDCSYGGLLGGLTQRNLGRFDDVEFIGGNLFGVAFQHPSFERSLFQCNMTSVDFCGSQLTDCSFQGTLNDVKFRGRSSKPGDPEWWGTLDIPLNQMRRVDFSRANFKEVYFCNGIDLGDCEFPTKGGVLYIKDGTEVFKEVARRIEVEWNDPDRRVGMAKARYFLEDLCHPKGQVVYIPQMMKKTMGGELARKFMVVVEEVMKEQGYDARTSLESQSSRD